MVERSKTPLLPEADLRAMGYSIILYANAALYLGAYENKLVSEVRAGENQGLTLRHDYVVLQWAGPFDLSSGRWSGRERLPLLPGAVPARAPLRPAAWPLLA